MKPSTKPLITVAIPTFNRARFLPTCLNSIFLQSYENIEILVCDNASSDETENIIAQCTDPRLRVVRHFKNIGLFPNWNACVSNARGEYFVLLSDDDVIHPKFLDHCVALLRAGEDVSVIIGVSSEMNYGKYIEDTTTTSLGTGVHLGTEVLTEYFRNALPIHMCSVLIRTETIRSCGGFDANHIFYGDAAVWLPILAKQRVGFIREPCGVYARHEGAVTNSMNMASLVNDMISFRNFVLLLLSESAADESQRPALTTLAKRFFATALLSQMRRFRDFGGGLVITLGYLWDAREVLWLSNIGDTMHLFGLGTLAHLLLPNKLVKLLVRLRDTSS